VSSSRVNPALLAIGRGQSAQQELIPRDEPLTVTQVTSQLKQTLEQRFARVAVVGEISGAKTVNGHCYFCLKDARSQLQAVIWARQLSQIKFRIEDGMQVVLHGQITVFEPRGLYQLRVDRIEPLGAGALQAAFEQTKAKLQTEGLFEQTRKREIALVPRTVAVVTSPTGAVIRDIINVATRRYPQARILVVPTKVQGAESAAWIARAIQRASAIVDTYDVSVILVARGGGSLEDLWGFNDEKVARAIAASPVPVVSGVGHEVDFTICDFVADVRAPTPSAAAELIFPLASELRDRTSKPVLRMRRALRRDLTRDRQRLNAARRVLGDGRSIIDGPRQRIDQLVLNARKAMKARLRDERLAVQRAESRIAKAHPRVHLAEARHRLAACRARIIREAQTSMREQRKRLAQLAGRLNALSPLAILDRGFALVQKDNVVVRDAQAVRAGDRIDIRVARGQIRAVVETSADED
jgi:exodeoxyribonuclease VII large subunit